LKVRLPPLKLKVAVAKPYIAKSSQWVRAPISGIFITRKKLFYPPIQRNNADALQAEPGPSKVRRAAS